MENLDIPFHKIEDSRYSWLITGQAGSGKSSLIRYIRAYSKRNNIFLASTGVAAQLIDGQTLHSFFGFQPGITEREIQKMKISKKKEAILSGIDAFIIDEISMVRADWLDCMDAYLRKFGKHPHQPFGGYRLLLSGDLFQLPPVVQSSEESIFSSFYRSPYFFSANSFPALFYQVITLQENYRQTDPNTMEILQQIRECKITKNLMKEINKRVIPTFETDNNEFCITLTSTHEKANQVNDQHLNLLSAPITTFPAFIEGTYPLNQYPTLKLLSLAVGAQVMFVSNDAKGRFVNGSLGKIQNIQENNENPIISVLLEDDSVIHLEREVFTQRKVLFDENSRNLSSEEVGRFVQFPIRLAWAITIHKSQGKTFRAIHIDMGNGAFAPGQAYVAMSRSRSFDQLSLQFPLQENDLIMDPRVQEFYRNLST